MLWAFLVALSDERRNLPIVCDKGSHSRRKGSAQVSPVPTPRLRRRRREGSCADYRRSRTGQRRVVRQRHHICAVYRTCREPSPFSDNSGTSRFSLPALGNPSPSLHLGIIARCLRCLPCMSTIGIGLPRLVFPGASSRDKWVVRFPHSVHYTVLSHFSLMTNEAPLVMPAQWSRPAAAL